MKLYNSYNNTVEEFKPIEDNKVKMYVCGPTVYDYAHLGHARCYITWDVLYRYLKFKGYDVTYCRNVTDVDDKILKKALLSGYMPSISIIKNSEYLSTAIPQVSFSHEENTYIFFSVGQISVLLYKLG